MKTILFSSKQAAVLSAALWALACGYRPVGYGIPGENRRLVIPVAENHTAAADLSRPLTTALRRAAARAGLTQYATDPHAAKLRVTVIAVYTDPGTVRAADGHLHPVDTVRHIEVIATLVGPGGETLISPRRFQAAGRSLAMSNPTAEEAHGSERRAALLDDLSAMIVREFFELKTGP